jgi:hypothetical protein
VSKQLGISRVVLSSTGLVKAFEDFYVGRGCGSPELYSVGPDWFVDEEFLVTESFELRPRNQHILARAKPSRFRLCQVSLL